MGGFEAWRGQTEKQKTTHPSGYQHILHVGGSECRNIEVVEVMVPWLADARGGKRRKRVEAATQRNFVLAGASEARTRTRLPRWPAVDGGAATLGGTRGLGPINILKITSYIKSLILLHIWLYFFFTTGVYPEYYIIWYRAALMPPKSMVPQKKDQDASIHYYPSPVRPRVFPPTRK